MHLSGTLPYFLMDGDRIIRVQGVLRNLSFVARSRPRELELCCCVFQGRFCVTHGKC